MRQQHVLRKPSCSECVAACPIQINTVPVFLGRGPLLNLALWGILLTPLPRPHLGDGYAMRAEDAILHGCIPLVVMDGVDAVFESILDWSRFSVRLPSSDIPRWVRNRHMVALHGTSPYSTGSCSGLFTLTVKIMLGWQMG